MWTNIIVFAIIKRGNIKIVHEVVHKGKIVPFTYNMIFLIGQGAQKEKNKDNREKVVLREVLNKVSNLLDLSPSMRRSHSASSLRTQTFDG